MAIEFNPKASFPTGQRNSVSLTEALPLDCLFQIFEYFTRQELAKMGRVSHDFNTLTNDQSLFDRLNENDPYTLECYSMHGTFYVRDRMDKTVQRVQIYYYRTYQQYEPEQALVDPIDMNIRNRENFEEQKEILAKTYHLPKEAVIHIERLVLNPRPEPAPFRLVPAPVAMEDADGDADMEAPPAAEDRDL